MDKTKHPNQIKMEASYTAMTERKYQEVIELLTEALDELMEKQVLELLDLRSTAYEKRGLLSRALNDAKLMIQYVPTSAIGYLKFGSIQLVNGKSGLAAENYKQGLNLVPRSHPLYLQMREEYEKALIRAQSHFDIIGTLPRELVHKILVLFENAEPLWVCVTVSQKWCDQIMHCGSWWNSVSIKKTNTELDQVVSYAFPLIRNCITHLELHVPLSPDLRKRYLTHLKNGGFTRIKVLSLKGTIYQLMEPVDFAIVLWQMRHTLTSLKLDFGEGKSYPLLSVFSACPNIEALYYITNGSMLLRYENKNDATTVLCKKLSNVELYYGGDLSDTTYSELCFYMMLCPNIRRLILKSLCAYPFLGDSGVSTFTDYCPKLKVLGLNCTDGVQDANTCGEHSASEKGLACMSVKFNYDSYFYQTAKHIQAQSHSLQRLTVAQTRIADQCYEQRLHIHTPQPTTYAKLHTLHYICYGGWYNRQPGTFSIYSAVQRLLGTIIQNSPELSNLSFMCTQISLHLRVILEQTIMTKIQALKLKSVYFNNATEEWYRSFLSSLDRVHTLEIQACDFLNDDVISSLAASKSVQELTIAQCKNLSSVGLTKFLKEVALRPSHSLQTLTLDSLPATLDISAARLIVKIKSLKKLKIVKNQSISVETVNDLIGQASYSTLETIDILDCFTVDIAKSWSDSVGRLKESGISLVIA